MHCVILAVFCLASTLAVAKDKNPYDYNVVYTVTAVSTSDSRTSHYCPMTVADGHTAYVIYSQTWQCHNYSVGDRIAGRLIAQGFVLSALPPVRTDKIELTYWKKGKLKAEGFVVETAAAVP